MPLTTSVRCSSCPSLTLASLGPARLQSSVERRRPLLSSFCSPSRPSATAGASTREHPARARPGLCCPDLPTVIPLVLAVVFLYLPSSRRRLDRLDVDQIAGRARRLRSRCEFPRWLVACRRVWLGGLEGEPTARARPSNRPGRLAAARPASAHGGRILLSSSSAKAESGGGRSLVLGGRRRQLSRPTPRLPRALSLGCSVARPPFVPCVGRGQPATPPLFLPLTIRPSRPLRRRRADAVNRGRRAADLGSSVTSTERPSRRVAWSLSLGGGIGRAELLLFSRCALADHRRLCQLPFTILISLAASPSPPACSLLSLDLLRHSTQLSPHPGPLPEHTPLIVLPFACPVRLFPPSLLLSIKAPSLLRYRHGRLCLCRS